MFFLETNSLQVSTDIMKVTCMCSYDTLYGTVSQLMSESALVSNAVHESKCAFSVYTWLGIGASVYKCANMFNVHC